MPFAPMFSGILAVTKNKSRVSAQTAHYPMNIRAGFQLFKNFIRNFMIGRYGVDHLNVAIVVVSLVLFVLGSITGIGLILTFSYILMALSLFRMLSRNIPRRRSENDRFIRYWWPFKTKISRRVGILKQRKTYKFIKCCSCRNTLRVPRHKGKLQITCPKCGERFMRKT